jgi:hypothetical protein
VELESSELLARKLRPQRFSASVGSRRIARAISLSRSRRVSDTFHVVRGLRVVLALGRAAEGEGFDVHSFNQPSESKTSFVALNLFQGPLGWSGRSTPE